MKIKESDFSFENFFDEIQKVKLDNRKMVEIGPEDMK